MTLRRDFSIHARKTVESFQLVRTDISSINTNIEHIKNMLASMELKISTFDNELLSLRDKATNHLSNLDSYKKTITSFEVKIEDINKLINDTTNKFDSMKEDIGLIASRNQDISGDLSRNNILMKRILPRIKSQTIKNRKFGSFMTKSQKEIDKLKKRLLKYSKFGTALRDSQEGMEKLKRFLNRKFKMIKAFNVDIETKIKNQRERAIQLNKKIEAKKIVKKRISKKPSKKLITSTKIKKMTTIKPIVKKVTRKIKKPVEKAVGLDKRIITSREEKIEPNKKTIVEVKEEEIKK